MRRFLRLLHKEWRDHRALILVWVCLAPILSQVAQWAFLDATIFGAQVVGRWILPSLVLFFLAALAAELVSRESQSGVGDSIGRLPLRPGEMWFTKLAFLVLVGVLSMTWLFVAELAWRVLLDRHVAPVFAAFRAASMIHVGLVVGTTLVFACGILVRNGFGGAALGLLVTFGSFFLISKAPYHGWGERPLSALSLWDPLWWASVIAVAALLASRLAYRPWRSQSGDARRRYLLFGSGLVLVLAPAGLAAVWRYHDAMEISFHDPRVQIRRVDVSPDGRLVSLEVGRRSDRRPTHDWLRGYFRRDIEDAWVLDLDTGDLQAMPDAPGGILLVGHWRGSPWTDAGELRVHTVGQSEYRLWNPRTGSVTWQDFGTLFNSWRWSAYGRRDGDHLITWPEHDIELTFPRAGSFPWPSPEPGVVFSFDEQGRLIRHSLLDGAQKVLLENCVPKSVPFISTDGTQLAVNHGDLVRYLDAETGEAVAATPEGWRHYSWTGLRDPWALCIRPVDRRGDNFRFLLVSDDEQREITVSSHTVSVTAIDRDRILLLKDNKRLLLVDGEGHTLRTLYEPHADE